LVAERRNLDMEEAFTALRNHARAHNVRLVEVARGVIDGTVIVPNLDSTSPD
jgi:AmiR/NasT family two-component response regulator